MSEQRQSNRLNITLPAWFPSADTDNSLTTAMTVNINNTGVCLLSAEKLETGREVPVTVTLPGNEKIIIRTTVIWARPVENSPTKEYRMGLRIIDPTKPDEKKLVEFYTGKARELGIT